jgi:hypothetical protein
MLIKDIFRRGVRPDIVSLCQPIRANKAVFVGPLYGNHNFKIKFSIPACVISCQ